MICSFIRLRGLATFQFIFDPSLSRVSPREMLQELERALSLDAAGSTCVLTSETKEASFGRFQMFPSCPAATVPATTQRACLCDESLWSIQTHGVVRWH
jgi:hypothetical protein